MTFPNYIAEGFLEDCEELIYTLTERYEIVDWQKFCTYWKEMEFDIMFYGRQSSPEVVEFTEEVLQVARLYLVTETDNFENQVIGLFIAYAITIIQPYKNLCALRVVPKDIPALKKIEAVARRDNRRDILVVLGKMYLCGKVQFHVSERERAMDASIRKYFDGSMNVPECVARRWRGELDRSRVRALVDIGRAEDQYMALKLKVKKIAEEAFPDTKIELDTFKPEAIQMAESLRKLTSGISIRKGDDEDLYVNTVKQRAMKKTVDSMRHLNSVADKPKVIKDKKARETSPKPSTSTTKTKKIKNDQKKKVLSPARELPPQPSTASLPSLDDLETITPLPKEDREGSPETPFKGFTVEEIKTSDYERMRETIVNKEVTKPSPQPIDLMGNKQNGKKKDNVSEQDNKKIRKTKNINNKKLRLTNDFNSDNNTDKNTNDLLNSIDTLSEPIQTLDELCKGKELTIQSKGIEKHFVEFEVSDSIVIRTEKDAAQKDIEIEYIDNYTGPNALYEEVCELSDEEDKKEKSKENVTGSMTSQNNVKITIEECDEFGETNDNMEIFHVVSEDTNIEKSKKIAKNNKRRYNAEVDDTMHKILSKTTRGIERRTLKQPNLRSKFKKMGILPVANFDDANIVHKRRKNKQK